MDRGDSARAVAAAAYGRVAPKAYETAFVAYDDGERERFFRGVIIGLTFSAPFWVMLAALLGWL